MHLTTRLIIAMLTLVSFQGFSQQPYHPMLQQDVMWQSYYSTWAYMENTLSLRYQFIDPANDITLNGHTYHMLEGRYMREDTALRHVYILQDSLEYLAYDFNLEVGDTISGFRFSWQHQDFDTPVKQWVTNISLVDVGGSTRKMWKFNDDTGIDPTVADWIEGIGSLHGPGHPSFCDSNELLCHLFCFRDIEGDPEVGMWEMGSGWSCRPTAVQDVSGERPVLAIYPNPASSQVQLKTHGAIGNIRLFDTVGKQVLYQQQHTWQQAQTLDVAALPGGMYILIAETPEGELRRKISIVR